MSPSKAKCNVIAGFLGVGKTTAIRALIEQRPQREKWAILVNEYGLVGIDGATLNNSADSGIAYAELPGGCICCSSNKPFRESVLQVLADVKPDRLLIEPTGLAEAGRLSYDLTQPPFAELIDLQATITLVDPRRFLQSGARKHPVYEDQIDAADVLVANRCDLATEEEVQSFVTAAKKISPSKSVVATTRMGVLDPLWLAIPHRTGTHAKPPAAPAVTHRHLDTHCRTPAPKDGDDRVTRWSNEDGHIATCGWIFPYRESFTRENLEIVFGLLTSPGPILPHGALRIKGIFRLDTGFELVNADADGVHWEPLGEQKDSRVEIITEALPEPNWRALEVSFMSATRPIPH